MSFSKLLINWYLQNRRDLPWRKTPQPYPVWLSEIMLQQTRVAQGMPYFLKFIEAFPTVNHLAAAPEEQVLKLWQGLGYYSRARNLHATAKYIANDLGGEFPDSYEGLLKLKGVGDYTAAAIASICYGEPVPVVDGNVYRVLSRYFGIEADISSPAAKPLFKSIAAEHLPPGQASEFNQAMMEFGALQCVPKNPDCPNCVLNKKCIAYNTGRVASLPVKLKKTKVTNRYFNYIIVKDAQGRSLVNKRSAKGIWHNLYEFPLLETENAIDNDEVVPLIKNHFLGEFTVASVQLLQDTIVHKLSHQHLHIRFWQADISAAINEALSREEIKLLPVPVVIHNFIEKHWD
ncbi:A/G-specific adenine glycosylase [Flavobacterium coralii]|uniref:A/G-specific adenine glycosylase n=1 Tax=Flavobacterium coralii TaxID=2838017 RepID=UPI000C542F43|nr:A/G-specific adenine glycosylase [Flavobacterium sp.]|tara:strand:- start:92287 stop:93324 length:1038 start_codon:yes stop_codon:yes gene_type:complete